MILFYKSGRVRVAIPTANFLDYDWRDIENVGSISFILLFPTIICPGRMGSGLPPPHQTNSHSGKNPRLRFHALHGPQESTRSRCAQGDVKGLSQPSFAGC